MVFKLCFIAAIFAVVSAIEHPPSRMMGSRSRPMLDGQMPMMVMRTMEMQPAALLPMQMSETEMSQKGETNRPQYSFAYGVHDEETGDIKEQKETRDGDSVRGYYAMKEADGRKRVVKYSADKESGFNAVVSHEGNAIHDKSTSKWGSGGGRGQYESAPMSFRMGANAGSEGLMGMGGGVEMMREMRLRGGMRGMGKAGAAGAGAGAGGIMTMAEFAEMMGKSEEQVADLMGVVRMGEQGRQREFVPITEQVMESMAGMDMGRDSGKMRGGMEMMMGQATRRGAQSRVRYVDRKSNYKY